MSYLGIISNCCKAHKLMSESVDEINGGEGVRVRKIWFIVYCIILFFSNNELHKVKINGSDGKSAWVKVDGPTLEALRRKGMFTNMIFLSTFNIQDPAMLSFLYTLAFNWHLSFLKNHLGSWDSLIKTSPSSPIVVRRGLVLIRLQVNIRTILFNLQLPTAQDWLI